MDGAITAPSLLSELRDAVYPSTGIPGAGGGSDSAAPSIINEGAVDLLGEIEKQARVELWEWKGFRIAGPIEETIRAFPYADGQWETYLQHITLDWLDRINSMLRPVKPGRKLIMPCPACGLTYHGPQRTVCLVLDCWTEDERMADSSDWQLVCGNCEAIWVGEELRFFLRSTPVGKGLQS